MNDLEKVRESVEKIIYNITLIQSLSNVTREFVEDIVMHKESDKNLLELFFLNNKKDTILDMHYISYDFMREIDQAIAVIESYVLKTERNLKEDKKNKKCFTD